MIEVVSIGALMFLLGYFHGKTREHRIWTRAAFGDRYSFNNGVWYKVEIVDGFEVRKNNYLLWCKFNF